MDSEFGNVSRLRLLFLRCTKAKPSLAFAKDFLAALQSFVTIVAFVAAAWWFITQRQTQPKLKVEHVISQRDDVRDPTRRLIGLEIRTTNIGNTYLDLNNGTIVVTDVNPGEPNKKAADGPPDERLLFKTKPEPIGLEPGEFDQALLIRFTVPANVRTLRVTTVFPLPGGKQMWSYTSLVDIGENAPVKSAAGFSSGTPSTRF